MSQDHSHHTSHSAARQPAAHHTSALGIALPAVSPFQFMGKEADMATVGSMPGKAWPDGLPLPPVQPPTEGIGNGAPVQRAKLKVSENGHEEKKKYGGPTGFMSYYGSIVEPWLQSQLEEHKENKEIVQTLERAMEQGGTVFYNSNSKFANWESLFKFIANVNKAIPEEAPEDKVEDVQEANVDAEEEEPSKVFDRLEITSGGSKLAIALEMMIGEGKRKSGFKTAKQFINQQAETIIGMLTELLVIAESSKDPGELLQLHRFTGTFEFTDLANNSNTKKAAGLIISALEGRKKTFTDTPTLLKMIPPGWNVTEIIATQQSQGLILDAPHGEDSHQLTPISDERFAQTTGELVLCIPLLNEILERGVATEVIKRPEDFATLVIKVLQGSVRRFKLDTIIIMLDYFQREAFPLLKTPQNITETGMAGLRKALLMALSGEGHRAKEQTKMMAALLQHLQLHPLEICSEYEPDTGAANYDILVTNREDNQQKVIEVESIPARERPNAYDYYKKKYQHKQEAIKLPQGAVLYIAIPPLTVLPEDQIQKIKDDETLMISNINEITPEKKGKNTQLKTAFPIIQRQITLTKEQVIFPTAAAAAKNMATFVQAAADNLGLVAAYLDGNTYVSYKDFVAEANFFSRRLKVIESWEVAQIPTFTEEVIKAWSLFDIEHMSKEQLSNMTPQQHKWLSNDQIGWFNKRLPPALQPEVKGIKVVTPATAQVGSDGTPTAVYAGNQTPYHEQQKQGWCGKHALNAFLGRGAFSEGDLYNLAVEMAGDKEKAMAHITIENADEKKIGDISIPFLKWILTKKLGLVINHYKLEDLSGPQLEQLLSDKNRMIITGSQRTKFPGETIHTSGHYAAARKDGTGKWWVINSTAAQQVQVDPKDYSKALEIIIESGPEQFKAEALDAAKAAQIIGGLSLADWKDDKKRDLYESAFFKLKQASAQYHKLTGQHLFPPQLLEKIEALTTHASTVELVFNADWEAEKVFKAKEEDIRNLAALVTQLK